MGAGFSRAHTQTNPPKAKVDEQAIKFAKKVNDEVEKVTKIERAAFKEDPGQFHDGELSWADIWRSFSGTGVSAQADVQRAYDLGYSAYTLRNFNQAQDPNWVDPSDREPSDRSLQTRTCILEEISPQQWLQVGQSTSAKVGSAIGKQIWQNVIERAIEGKSATIPNALELYQTYERAKEVANDFKTLTKASDVTVDQHGHVRVSI